MQHIFNDDRKVCCSDECDRCPGRNSAVKAFLSRHGRCASPFPCDGLGYVVCSGKRLVWAVLRSVYFCLFDRLLQDSPKPQSSKLPLPTGVSGRCKQARLSAGLHQQL